MWDCVAMLVREKDPIGPSNVRASAVTAPSTAANSDLARPRNVALGHGRRYRHSSARSAVPPAPENRYALRCFGVVPDSDTRSRLKCAPTVTPLGFPLPYQIVVQGSKPRARLLELFDAPSRRQRRGARASHAAGSARFEPCCPVLRRYFGEARPVATTIEAGLIDGRAKITIEVSA